MPATLTASQQEAARKASRAAAERQRRSEIKAAKEALEKAGLDPDTKIDATQRKRAATSKKEKAGLTGRSLAAWILEGKGGREQVQDARAAREQTAREERTRQNVTRSADPEASELAAKAKALAPDIKSSFLPKEGREFIDTFSVTASGQTIEVSNSTESAEFKRTALKAFAQDGEKDKDVRAALAGLGQGTRLWGRKLGLFILATDAQR